MTTVYLIAADSIRALLHKRLLVALALLALGVTAALTLWLDDALEAMRSTQDPGGGSRAGAMSEEELENLREGLDMMGPVFLSMFYGLTMFVGQLVSLYICCAAVSADIRSGTIRVVLAKPVSRVQFLLGKYFGAITALLVYSAVIGFAMLVFARTNHLDLNVAAQYAPWLMFCANLVVGSVGFLLSLLIHPLVAGLVAFFASATLLSPPNPLYFMLPSYDRFNVAGMIMDGRLIAADDVLLLTLYAVDVAAIMLLLAFWRFRTREVS